MSSCKNNCTCSRCKPCGFPTSKIKAIDACQVQPVPSSPSPAYRNFWFTGSQPLINPGDVLPFTNDSPTQAGGITRTGNIITIPLAGDYLISYVVTVSLASNLQRVPSVQVELGPPFTVVPNAQTTFALVNGGTLTGNCVQMSGEALITIPIGGSQLRLRNNPTFGTPYFLCDTNINAVALNIIKLSA